MREFGWTKSSAPKKWAKRVITNTLRLLNLPPTSNRPSSTARSGDGPRAPCSLPNAKAQSAACRAIVEKGLSVRQVEQMTSPAQPKKTKRAVQKDANIAAIEDELRRSLGTRVSVSTAGKDLSKGKIVIDYYSLDDFDRILNRLRSER